MVRPPENVLIRFLVLRRAMSALLRVKFDLLALCYFHSSLDYIITSMSCCGMSLLAGIELDAARI
jgi:hypothetical protein